VVTQNRTPKSNPPSVSGKKKYPSRANIQYVAIPLRFHDAPAEYARQHSDEDDEKSVSWAARVALRRFLTAEGLLPPRDDKEG
jgi:hypothetical protein